MDGFAVDPRTLSLVWQHLHQAAARLDEGNTYPGTTNAGVSSDVVAEAVERVKRCAVVFAQGLDTMADEIDFADASYRDLENNSAGSYKLSQMGYPPTHSGELRNASDRYFNSPAKPER